MTKPVLSRRRFVQTAAAASAAVAAPYYVPARAFGANERVITGAIGVAAAVAPGAWMGLFTTEPAIRDAGAGYLRIVGGFYGFFGLGLALFFASQGVGRLAWPLTASATRLAVVAVGGWICVRWLQAPAETFFAVVSLSYLALGSTLAVATHLANWGSPSAR